MAEYDKTMVVVAGHTDTYGGERFNLDLSKPRASSVSGYLRSKKMLPIRLEATGFGESQPLAENDSAAGKQLNRRVELTLLPITTS